MEQTYAATIPGDEPGRTTRLPRRPGTIVRPAGRQPPRRLLDVTAVGRDDPERAGLETYVRTAFNRSHDADVSTFMPTLLAFRDGAGSLRGVLGIRSAADAPLYLENYLDRPVEQAIVAAGYHPVERDVLTARSADPGRRVQQQGGATGPARPHDDRDLGRRRFEGSGEGRVEVLKPGIHRGNIGMFTPRALAVSTAFG